MDDFASRSGSQGSSFEDYDDALQEVDELIESFDNRLTLSNLRLPERYIDGKLKLLVEARWRSVDFNIVFERENSSKMRRSASVDHIWHPAGTGTEHPQGPVGSNEHPGTPILP